MKYGLAIALLLGTSVFAESEIEFTTFWNTEGELKALNEISKRLEEKGIHSEVSAIDGYSKLRDSIYERISIGQPPEASHWQWSKDLLALALASNLNPLPDKVNGLSIEETVIPEALNQISYDGEFIAIPVGIHLQGVILYNQSLLEKVGITTEPKTWDAYFETAEKLKAIGIQPVALSDASWILRDMFDSVLGSVGGKNAIEDMYLNFNKSGKLKETLTDTFDIMFKIEKYSDAEFHDRKWWQMIDKVVKGEAASTFIGDYAQAQITSNPEELAKNVICKGLPGEQVANFGVDVFVSFESQLANWKDDYPKYVETILNPDTQKAYLSFKGGIPILKGLKQSELAQCASNSLMIWEQNPDAHIAVPSRDDIAISKLYRALPPIWASKERDPSVAAGLIYDYLGNQITEQELLDKLKPN